MTRRNKMHLPKNKIEGVVRKDGDSPIIHAWLDVENERIMATDGFA